jgi:hypothetical protein
MVSLGLIGSLADIDEINFSGGTDGAFQPLVTEGFGIKISRCGEVKYAAIRVLNIDSARKITFELVYPFAEVVMNIP